MELELVSVLVIIYLLIIVNYFNNYNYGQLVYIKSTIDNNYYLVRNEPKTKVLAANTLAQLNQQVIKLLTFLKNQMKTDNEKETMVTKLLLSRYNPSRLTEGLIEANSTTYTINKGSKIVFCLSSRTDNKVYDLNTLTFVTLHELAHIGSKSEGHGDEFRFAFKFLVNSAIKAGIYSYQDYSRKPQEYCGLTINANII